MNETELERLVVRLIGDSTGYLEMLKKAQSETARTADNIDKNVEKVKNSWLGVTTALAGAVAGLKAGEFLKGAFSEFSNAEAIGVRLNAVLKANGREVESTTASYIEFANQLQRTTKQEDDATLALLKQAESFDLTGAAAKKASQDAIALAEINDSSAEAMIRLTAAMAKGDTETAMLFARMVPQLRGIRNETEFTVRYQRLIAAGMDAAAESAGTTAGKIKQLENDYGNLKETIGSFVAEAVSPLVEKGKGMVALFERQPEALKETATYVGIASAAFVTMATTGENAVEIVKHLGKEMKEFGKTVIAVPPQFLIIAAVATAAAITIREMSKELRGAVEESEKLDKKLGKIARRQGDESMENVRRALPEDRRKVINDELAKARKLEADQKAAVKRVEDELNALTGGATLPAVGAGVTGGIEAKIAAARALLTQGAQEAMKQVGVTDADTAHAQDRLRRLRQDLETFEKSVRDLETEAERAGKPVGNFFVSMAEIVTEVGKRWKEANMEKVKEFMSDAASITERMKTPLEKATEERTKLLGMLLARAITQDTYARALKDLEGQLNKTADAQRNLNAAVSYGYGTTEAATRIQEYLNSIGGGNRGHIDNNFARGMGKGAGAGLGGGEARGGAGPGPIGGRDPWTWEGVGEAKSDKVIELLGTIASALTGAGSVGVVRSGGS